jgi:nicotinamidase-related amidase
MTSIVGDRFTAPHYSTSALLTIDLQRDFLDDGSSAVPGTAEALAVVGVVASAYRRAALPVVHVVRLYRPDGSNAELSRRQRVQSGASVVSPGSDGSQLAAGLLPAPTDLDADLLLAGGFQSAGNDEYIMYKPRWNAYFGTELDRWLRARGVDTVVIVGCNYPNCPRGTVFGASERDYRIVVVSDAVSGWTPNAADELGGLGVTAARSAEVVNAVEQTI